MAAPPAANEQAELLRMGELAERSGVPAATIKHYRREGLLPDPIKTSRNMAYYPVEFVERIQLIKRLQEERFMPLKVIRKTLEAGSRRAVAILALEDTIIERSLLRRPPGGRLTRAQVHERYGLAPDVLDVLERIDVLSPASAGYGGDDAQILEAVARFRDSGYQESLGFTVYDVLIYKRNLEPMVKEEVGLMMERLSGRMSERAAAELIERGIEPLRDLVSALHAKLLVAELDRQAAGG